MSNLTPVNNEGNELNEQVQNVQSPVEGQPTTNTPLENAMDSSLVDDEPKNENQPEAEHSSTAFHEESDDIEHGEEDYAHLDKKQLLAVSEQLLQESNFKKVDQVLKAIKAEFDRLHKEEREEARQKFLAEGGEPDSFEFKHDELSEKFYANFKLLKERKAKHFADIEKRKQKNLEDKNAIIAQIKNLVDSGDTGKAAFEKLKELQAKWKEVGAVPAAEADDLYKTYNALLDRFYSQKNMENELMELDRRKNLTAKIEVCEKAEALLQTENINEAIAALNKLHDEYKSIGPAPKEEQEALWQRFKLASDKVYEKKRAYLEEVRVKLEENMRQKQALCLQIEPYAEFASDRIAEWNAKTKEILALQKSWEAIGPAPREVAKDLNKQFWANFKGFFANKGKYFDQLEKYREENLAKKTTLCEQAEALKESADWDATAAQLKQLQDQWKEVGPVAEAQRDSIYERFKAACDHFFNRKRNRRQEEEKTFDANLAKKRELCEQIEKLAKEKETDIEKLEDLYDAFMQVGFVPRKHMNSIQDKLAKAVDHFLANLDVASEEKESIKVSLQLRTFDSDPNADRKLIRKEQALRKKITTLEDDISLWKNNLAFFANSKTADKLKTEFNAKVKAAEEELEKLRMQLKALQKTMK